MKIFYGWIIVGAGIVVTCIGMGAMLSLGIFLQRSPPGWAGPHGYLDRFPAEIS